MDRISCPHLDDDFDQKGNEEITKTLDNGVEFKKWVYKDTPKKKIFRSLTSVLENNSRSQKLQPKILMIISAAI